MLIDQGLERNMTFPVDVSCKHPIQKNKSRKNRFGSELKLTFNSFLSIQSRRENLGLSQSDLATKLGVTKSLVSLIESGKRQPTHEQIDGLSQILMMPTDLLCLETRRLPTDVEHYIENNTASAIAMVRRTAEDQIVCLPQAPAKVYLPTRDRPKKARSLPEKITVAKTSSAYRAHSYHTKVPPEAITPFIEAFTHKGELVYDPFCGSGMTGVAALSVGRNALLSDLSPAAVHISKNYTTPCPPEDLERNLQLVAERIGPTMEWLYRVPGDTRTIEYTTWSDVFLCPSCKREILFWDVVQREKNRIGREIECPRCSSKHEKSSLNWIGEKPVVTHTSASGRNIQSHETTKAELDLISASNQTPIPYWVPDVKFTSEREMWRAGHQKMGVNSVTAFFTSRNLHALAALRHTILSIESERAREALMFAFTACVNRASKRYQWNAKRPTNVMTGTLYISSLRYEWNVWSLFKRKAADALRYYKSFQPGGVYADVFQRSADDIGCVADGTVDMVFMDPPFGSNIFYADASLLWEAWLGQLTDQSAEMVVNKHRSTSSGGKSLADYGELMQRSFEQTARVLKPSGMAVLAFSNSNDKVWEVLRESVQAAGYNIQSAHILNKGQPSIKGVKGVSGKERVTTLDLVMCLEKKSKLTQVALPAALKDGDIEDLTRSAFEAPTHPEGLPLDEVYSRVIRNLLERDLSVIGITMPSIESALIKLGAKRENGKWTYLAAQEGESDSDFLAGYLGCPEAYPKTSNPTAPSKSIGPLSTKGKKNSTYYTAHSYHTKVPPEAITPFLEHYSKPGDVVLDLFSGSGMTGVACALAGRRAILNDLSPAAAHLAWNHTRPCDPTALKAAFNRLEAEVKEDLDSLYATESDDGKPAVLRWMMWSSKHQCPHCERQFLLWDAIDKKTGKIGTTLNCPDCAVEIKRSALVDLGSEPSWVCYASPSGPLQQRAPTAFDIAQATSTHFDEIDAWYPTTSLASDREMHIRCALHLRGINDLKDFYTPRNLKALAIIWRAILKETDDRLKRVLAFAFTNTAWHGTKMRRFNARGGQRPLTGTLYVPQLSSEANVLDVMRNKIGQLQRYYRAFKPEEIEAPTIITGSASSLNGIEDNSIDYVFTDPPFGSNIFYSDCNFIWESWLGNLTDPALEAVVNKSLGVDRGGKSIADYKSLMLASMQEAFRVLKPGGWATVVFNNTDPNVWEAIHQAAEEAGFQFHEASSLDRAQQSHKGYKGRSGMEDVAHFDVIFNLRKAKTKNAKRKALKARSFDLEAAVKEIADQPEIANKGLQGIYAEVMRRVASSNPAVAYSYAEVKDLWNAIQVEMGVAK
ncbi:hypothetical protein L53_12910 [Hyphomonas sp. L-53-1-40]|nr:hypothetical protein L53_12910 [Hyphomonas sp. L-53-1-40]